MIEGIKITPSENPIGQIWKFLRLLTDVDYTSLRIRQIQNLTDPKIESNIKKQATQIGYCIRQAEEYFQASARVGLATRPTLMYYGAVSLSSALVLLCHDGNYSFDALRRSKKHAHHGLDLDRGLVSSIKPEDGLQNFLASLQCGCHINNGTPWGNFPLFYESLTPGVYQVDQDTRLSYSTVLLKGATVTNCFDIAPLKNLAQRNLNVFDLVKTLPDLFATLKELGLEPQLCSGSLKSSIFMQFVLSESGSQTLQKSTHTRDYFIDMVNTAQKARLIELYAQSNPALKLVADLDANLHLQLVIEVAGDETYMNPYLPDIIDDVNGKKYYILYPDQYVSESAALLAILFCFGMLSRYYPDIWMKTIDKSVGVTEFTDSLLNVVYRKFPNLILDQMTRVKHYVHL